MDKLGHKIKLVETCRAVLNKRIQELKMSITDAQQSANEYGPPKDRYDAFRNIIMRKNEISAQQLEREQKELSLLERIDLNQLMTRVQFGSVVITQKQKIFVGLGLGKLDFENESWFVISPQVPYYLAMAGKKEGESFEFRGETIKIIELY